MRVFTSPVYHWLKWCGSVVFQASLDEQKSIFSVQLQNDFYTFKNGNFFIAFKHGGTIKKNRADKNGRSVKRSTRFVLIDRQPSRKRRFPTGSDFRQDDLQRRWVAAKVRTSAKEIQNFIFPEYGFRTIQPYNLTLLCQRWNSSELLVTKRIFTFVWTLVVFKQELFSHYFCSTK